ncbi:hypothetical protein RB195_014590 [Necator americanus]|uniref:Uncharacterized protein n=1 Tax=Necator americanus TaxID=51031 RepID=A0ABR1E0Z6_NECAM
MLKARNKWYSDEPRSVEWGRRETAYQSRPQHGGEWPKSSVATCSSERGGRQHVTVALLGLLCPTSAAAPFKLFVERLVVGQELPSHHCLGVSEIPEKNYPQMLVWPKRLRETSRRADFVIIEQKRTISPGDILQKLRSAGEAAVTDRCSPGMNGWPQSARSQPL